MMNRRNFVKENGDIDYIAYTSFLENTLKQKDNAIDECFEYIENIKRVDNYLDGVPCDELLEKLQQAKGGCDDAE